MSMSKLSDRLRPDVEAAPWVIDAVRELEAERAGLRELIRHMDIEHDSSWWSRGVRERIAAALEGE